MKQFLKNKWYLHALALPVTYFFLWAMQRNFLNLADVGVFFQSLIAVFFLTCIAFAIEWVSGVRGYIQTDEQFKQSELNILLSIAFFIIGVVLFWILK